MKNTFTISTTLLEQVMDLADVLELEYTPYIGHEDLTEFSVSGDEESIEQLELFAQFLQVLEDSSELDVHDTACAIDMAFTRVDLVQLNEMFEEDYFSDVEDAAEVWSTLAEMM